MRVRAYLVLISVLTLAGGAFGQEPRVYKGSDAVATVSFRNMQPAPNGVRGVTYVVNYSDLIIHLAVRPDPLSDPIPSEDLKWALEQVINEKLLNHAAQSFLQKRRIRFSMGDVEARSTEIAKTFSSNEFERRLKLINDQVTTERIRLIYVFVLTQMQIEKYLELKFPSGSRDKEKETELERLRAEATIVSTKRL
jgi:hypothetical protein